MTTKKAAGYFDSLRDEPMYTGDVYVKEKEEKPYYTIVDNIAMGIVVNHVGTTEVTPIARMGAQLVQMQYIGNQIDTPNLIEEFETERISEKPEEAEIAEAGKTSNEFTESSETGVEETEEKAGENEQICSTDSDVSNAGIVQTSNDEHSEEETGTDDKGNSEETSDKPDENFIEEGAVSAEATTGNSNVIVETAKCAVPEVIANTAEEKKALLRIQTIKRCISADYDKIAELQNTVEYHKNLASTLDYKPFVKLKDIVSEALHSNVDEENLKGLKDNTKNFESIINIQNLLKEHKKKADDAEYDILKLEDEIFELEKEQIEIEQKIDTFAKQTKLPLDSTTKSN